MKSLLPVISSLLLILRLVTSLATPSQSNYTTCDPLRSNHSLSLNLGLLDTNASKVRRMWEPGPPRLQPNAPLIILPDAVGDWIEHSLYINYAFGQTGDWERWVQGDMAFGWMHRGVNVRLERQVYNDLRLRADLVITGRVGQPNSVVELRTCDVDKPVAEYCRQLRADFARFTGTGISQARYLGYQGYSGYAIGIAKGADLMHAVKRLRHNPHMTYAKVLRDFSGTICPDFRHDEFNALVGSQDIQKAMVSRGDNGSRLARQAVVAVHKYT